MFPVPRPLGLWGDRENVGIEVATQLSQDLTEVQSFRHRFLLLADAIGGLDLSAQKRDSLQCVSRVRCDGFIVLPGSAQVWVLICFPLICDTTQRHRGDIKLRKEFNSVSGGFTS